MHETLIELLIAGDHTRPEDGPHLSAEFLRDTIDFAKRYAHIEKALFGGTRVVYSPSALGLNLSTTGDLVTQGEELAQAERARFELPAGPILEIDRLIEDQGIKVIPRAFPVGTVARGGFFFDSSLGPCIFHDAAATVPERDYILAHEYGHFLADYEPYTHTICGHPGPGYTEDPREIRAHQFALAFLMPASDMQQYRDASDLGPGEPIRREFVQQLQVYFAVNNEIVLWRLLSLGWLDAAGIEWLMTEGGGLLPEIDLEQTSGDARLEMEKPTPERFIHLVASAFGRGLIEVDEAAELLEVEPLEAARVLGQFKYENPAESESAGTARKARGNPAPPSLN